MRKNWNSLSLRNPVKKTIQQIPKEILNCIYAEHVFPKNVQNWNTYSPFGRNTEITNVDCLTRQWYSKSEFNDPLGNFLFVILDAYHQPCKLRRAVCSSGMKAAGIRNKPFLSVAEVIVSNGCGLNISLVRDLVDKQSVTYAVQTFTESVEKALIDIGGMNEAKLYGVIRNWYHAVDEQSVSAYDRCLAMLELREWLLEGVSFTLFPHSGAYVKDIPIVLYGGLLIGIEPDVPAWAFRQSKDLRQNPIIIATTGLHGLVIKSAGTLSH